MLNIGGVYSNKVFDGKIFEECLFFLKCLKLLFGLFVFFFDIFELWFLIVICLYLYICIYMYFIYIIDLVLNKYRI